MISTASTSQCDALFQHGMTTIAVLRVWGTMDDHSEYRTLLTQVENSRGEAAPSPGFRAGKNSSIEASWSNLCRGSVWVKLKFRKNR